MKVLLLIVFILYLVYTIRYMIYYVKLDCHFSRKQKILNGILIWIIPFAWIQVLKVVLKPKEYIFPKEFKPEGTSLESVIGDE